MTTPALETFRQTFGDFSDRTVSVYVPRPAVETGGEKWRILRKNVVDAVRDQAPDATFIADRLADFELADFRGNGIALFDDGKHQRMAHLSARPVASITVSEAPFILPLLADFQARQTHWVLFITRDEPKLFLYSGGHVSDMTDRLDAPKYRSVEARRHVQDDVFFHSAARGGTGGDAGGAVYHALGADKEGEREKTDEAFYQDVFNSVRDALPAQTETLHLIGEAGTVGHFAELVSHGRFEIVQHQAGGSVDVEQHIIEAFEAEAPDGIELPEGKTLPDLKSAAKAGQLGTLYIPLEHASLEDMHAQADEHLRLRAMTGEDQELADNRTTVLALQNGADILWYEAGANGAVPELRADLRW